MMKKPTLFIATIGIITSINAQKFNLDKIMDLTSKGTKVLAFSNDDAIKVSKETIAYMDKTNTIAGAKDPYTLRLNKLVSKFKTYDGLNLNYKVYKTNEINAVSTADGSIRIFSSLMDYMTDNELLAIIGHEIGHIKNQDTKDAIKTGYLKATALDVANTAAGNGQVNKLNQSQLGKMANEIMDASYSKKQESEADMYSYDFLKDNKYDVMGAYTAFKKFSLIAGSNKTGFQNMFSSHPDNGKRSQNIKKKAEKDGLWKDPGEVVLPQSKLTK